MSAPHHAVMFFWTVRVWACANCCNESSVTGVLHDVTKHKYSNVQYRINKLTTYKKKEKDCRIFQLCKSFIAIFFTSTNTMCQQLWRHRTCRGTQAGAAQPHSSITDGPAGTICLSAELMPSWPWSAVSYKSLFSFSFISQELNMNHKYFKTLNSIFSFSPPYVVNYFPKSKHICAYSKPEDLC